MLLTAFFVSAASIIVVTILVAVATAVDVAAIATSKLSHWEP